MYDISAVHLHTDVQRYLFLSYIQRKLIIKYKSYQDSVEALRNTFKRLNLVLIGEVAIRFKDAALFALIRPLWDTDGDGMIIEGEAAKVQSFPQNTFNRNQNIISLDELELLGGYIYHSGTFGAMPNLVTASVGNKLNLTTKLPDTFTMYYNDCPKLERIKLTENIRTISNGSFANDVSLKTIIWGGDEVKIGQQSFNKCSSLEHVQLPSSVSEIGYAAFRECTSLNNINLGKIKTIGSSVFSNCTNLTIDINMPLLEGEVHSLFSSSGITSVSNLGKITKVDYFAFGTCANLKYIILPDTLAAIGASVFRDSQSLEYVVFRATVPPSLDGSAFYGIYCTIYVPDASLNTYKTATNWISLASRIKPISEKP